MNLDVAIKKMKSIEKSIISLKKAGYNVYCENNEKLILESNDLQRKNTNKSFSEASKGVAGYGSIQHNFTDLDSDYEFFL